MWANRIVNFFIMLLAWIFLPIGLVTTFVLGIIVTLSFGLLLIPISLIWIVFFLGPMLLISMLWEKAPLLRPFLAIIGIPTAVIGTVYVWLTPSMGELESRYSKLVLCETFPYTYECMSIMSGKKALSQDVSSELADIIFNHLPRRNPDVYQYLLSLCNSREASK